MATLRNRFFLEGIILGGLCGVVLGSLIAFQIGGERVNEIAVADVLHHGGDDRRMIGGPVEFAQWWNALSLAVFLRYNPVRRQGSVLASETPKEAASWIPPNSPGSSLILPWIRKRPMWSCSIFASNPSSPTIL